MKRLISCLLAVVMLLTLFPVSAQAAEVTASGTCGENLTWTLDSAGTLTISGTGSMEFVNNNCPWYDYKYNINTVVLENGVTSIEDDAFYGCENMTRVTIPDSVTSIGQSAFRECYSLREVSISRYVTYIGNYAFQFCTRMTGIYVASGNPNYSSEAGALYNKNKTELLRVPGGFYGTLVVPNTVTTIAPSAFQSCDGLYGVELPDSVTSIGLSAFLFCKNLKKITIPASVTSIGDYAFGSCQNLTEITFKGDAPSIAREAFLNATATAYYPAGNATWTEEVRQNYGGTITWKPYVVTVADGTCGENLTWTLDSAGTLTISGTGPMDNYSYDYFQGSDIPWYEHMASINKVVIEDGVTTIGNYAFYECGTLTSVSIPESVTVIGNMAFANCRALENVTIPDSVTVIGEYGFSTCTALTSITIPDGVTTIGERTFAHCTALTSVTIPGSVTTIGTAAFDGCESLMSVVIPEGVTTIGDMAFTNCFSLTSVTFPSTLTHIGTFAFAYCCDLPSVTIPASVTTIEEHAFSYCNILEGIWVEEGNEFFSSDDRGVLFNKDQTVLLVAPDGMRGEYVIPDSVKTIGYYAFYRCNNLTSITIPDSVTAIDREAFGICEGLTSITIPESVTSIGESAFYWCAINEITFEGDAPSFGEHVFYNVTATAYYPAGNTTWTEEAMQDYGGTITWVPYSDEAAVPTLTLKYPTLSFESEVLYNVYFTVADAEVAVEDLGLLTWYEKPASLADATVENAQYNIPGGIYNPESGEYMVRTQGVPAMRMGDDLYLRVYAKLSDGTYAYSNVTYYSAKFYANDMLTNSQSAATKALCVAMLNYGATAQQHFGHNTDNLMNGHLTEEQKNLVTQWSSDMMSSVIMPDAGKVGDFVSNGGFSGGYPSVSFDGAFAINYFFTANQTPDTDILLYFWDEETYLAESVLTATNAVRVVPMKETETSGRYMAAYAGIPAKDIGKTLFAAAVYECDGVRYSSPVVPYSLSAYCQDRIDNGSDTMKALARETAVYGWYAENYFSK